MHRYETLSQFDLGPRDQIKYRQPMNLGSIIGHPPPKKKICTRNWCEAGYQMFKK